MTAGARARPGPQARRGHSRAPLQVLRGTAGTMLEPTTCDTVATAPGPRPTAQASAGRARAGTRPRTGRDPRRHPARSEGEGGGRGQEERSKNENDEDENKNEEDKDRGEDADDEDQDRGEDDDGELQDQMSRRTRPPIAQAPGMSGGDAQPSVGVEEEFFLVAPDSRAVQPAGVRVAARARKRLDDLVTEEFTEYQLEGRTPPCRTFAELHAALLRTRAELAAAAEAEGLRLLPSGTPVLGPRGPAPVLDDPRHRRGLHAFRALNDDYALCALHTHVQVPDRERAVLVGNHLRPWIPLLIALAANSPYWYGRDTGYASWRTLVKNGWPVAGPPPYFTGAEHYEHTTAALRESGAIVDAGNLFWDVRPCDHLPTVEFRAMDVPPTAATAAALAVLVRALVVTALSAIERGDAGPALDDALLRAACWRAARDGWSGWSADVRTGRLLPTGELAAHLLDHVRPALADGGGLGPVTALLHRLASRGDGATHQRRAHARRTDLADVVDHLTERACEGRG